MHIVQNKLKIAPTKLPFSFFNLLYQLLITLQFKIFPCRKPNPSITRHCNTHPRSIVYPNLGLSDDQAVGGVGDHSITFAIIAQNMSDRKIMNDNRLSVMVTSPPVQV
jgi:hypothetical protein